MPETDMLGASAYVLRDVRVLDEAGGFTEPTDVVVRDGAVVRVERGASAGDAVSHDCAGLWLMPGAFDCHVHVMFSERDPMQALRTPITRWTLGAVRNLAQTLRGGITSLRDAGGADAGVRDAVAGGLIPGPRLQVATVVLSQTGGHIDGFLAGPGFEMSAEYVLPDYPGRPPCIADGPEGVRRAVRQILRSGADWIKLCTTGGIISEHTSALDPEFTFEEISIAVHEAACRDKRVMVHAFGGEGLENAVRAGVRSVEHGIFLTEEQAALMAGKGCFLVPTLAIVRDVVAFADAGTLPDFAQRKAQQLKGVLGQAVAIAREAGVPIAMGTDFISTAQHGRNLEEIALMHEAGLTLEEALLAATLGGARLCRVDDRLGRVAPGYAFDAILLDEEPSAALFKRPGIVTGVFKGGVPVVPHERLRIARDPLAV